jgi:integrase/recombinase XerD
LRFIREMEIRNYSPRTIRCYVSLLAIAAKYFHFSPDKLTTEQIKNYLQYCIKQRGFSVSTINQIISAFRILFQDVLGKPWEKIKIKRPRKNRHLPDILSREEISKMIQLTANLKHKVIIAVLYSSGLRREELLNLKIRDIDSDCMLIRVRNGKGNKSRDTLLAQNTLELLRSYYRFYHPSEYLFESYRSGTAYSGSSVIKVVQRASQRANITKHIYPHSLRHTFATHLLEQGTNLKVIQKLLGHASLRSTMIYLHLARTDYNNVKSPFDHTMETV